MLIWPAVSSDLSPIEHVWDEMERRLCHHIPHAFFNNLVISIRRHFQACINANDGHTRYWLCWFLKSLVLFKSFTKLIQVTLNVIGLMVWWKMHYLTIYCTQLIEEQTTQWPKEKVKKDKQRFSKHAYKTKDRVTRTPLKPRVLWKG